MVKDNWLPRLQRLGLESCTSLKTVPFLPPRLLQLHVRDCDELIQLPLLSDTLLKLELIRCPKLQALTNLSPTVTNLTIEDCPNLMQPSTFNKSPSFCDLSFLTSLESLCIKGFSNLDALNLCPISSRLWIEDCPKLTRLGNLQCCTSFRELQILKCPKLTGLGNLQCCTSLRELEILKCPMLRREEASLVEGVAEGDTANRLPHAVDITADDLILVLELVQQQAFSSIKQIVLTDCAAVQNLEMPSSLETLHIRDCPKLQALTNLSPTVTNLTIEDCPNMTQPSTVNKSPSFCDLSFLTSLNRLSITGFSNLDALNLCPISSWLEIKDCPKLTKLGNLQCCTSLRVLEILKCPMLRIEEASLVEGVAEGDTANRLPYVEEIYTDDPLLVLELVQQQALSSIKILALIDCAAVENLEMLSSLETLHIIGCPDVEYLPNLPVSLRRLLINGCPILKEKYEEGGPLSNTISHIPEIWINLKLYG